MNVQLHYACSRYGSRAASCAASSTSVTTAPAVSPCAFTVLVGGVGWVPVCQQRVHQLVDTVSLLWVGVGGGGMGAGAGDQE
jgi:hypothetical protein